jgi:hypothetical protein
MQPEDIKNLALYCFSALIQADAAVFGLLAVFAVYQLQSLGSNQMNSYNLISSPGTSAKSDFEFLLLPIPLPAKYWILKKHGGSAYHIRLMRAAAFTDEWKSNVISTAKWSFCFLIIHAAFASFGLYFANELTPVLFVPPLLRIIIVLSTFVLLLAVISYLGYRFLSKESYGHVSDVPSIDLASLTVERLKSCMPHSNQYGHLYVIAADDTKFIDLTLGNAKQMNVAWLLKLKDGNFRTGRSCQILDDATLQSLIQEMQSNPETYWPGSQPGAGHGA